mmetsp:Transcript_13219/g.19242  ORF Transcript_13219/g.19242 Transcript_13219/m.19242 type:complete len:82 (+) Transcript_13219:259-504(+)
MGSQQSTNIAPPPNPTTDERIANETVGKSIPNNEPTPVSKRKKENTTQSPRIRLSRIQMPKEKTSIRHLFQYQTQILRCWT